MRTNPKFWSDEFDVVDDPDFTVFFEDDSEADLAEEPFDNRQRYMTPWQRLEERLGERQLRADLDEWDYWDETLAAH